MIQSNDSMNNSSQQKIVYEVNGNSGQIFWIASEAFKELSGKKFQLGEMEAVIIQKRNDITDTAKLLLSAVAGAVIQRLIDTDINPADIFKYGVMEVK